MDRPRWEQIQTAFDELVELAPADRDARLDTLGNTDPALRAAVEAMLAADAAADLQLAPLDTALRAPSAGTPDLFGLSGRTVSHFLVHEPLGAGGMGVVYRADDAHLGRPVALKFLLPRYQLDPSAKARFIREAKSGAALDHPNLCTIHEVGTTDDGQLFFAMPLYAGETLKARLEREPVLPVRDALAIARHVAAGLAYAHQAGIVHRDLKPGNVMLLADGDVKILDFGLAKARDQSVTETGARFGTVSYMAPEQVRGGAVDGRTDLWALGVLLYEMLTGRKPFPGDEEIAVAHAIIHDEPLPAPADTLRADVREVLEDVVLRLLQKDPAGRYASAAGVLEDLAAVEHAPGGFARALRRRWGRVRHHRYARRRWIAVAGISLTVGVISYAATRPGDTPAPAPARTAIAVLPFQNLSAAGPNAYLAGALHGEILAQLHKVPSLRVIGQTSVMSYNRPNPPPLRQIARELGVGSVVEGSVQVVGGRVRVNVQLVDAATDMPLWVEQYDRVLADAFALQRDIAQQIVATVGVVLGSAERQALANVPTEKAQAYLLYLQGQEIERGPDRASQKNLEATERLYERAIALDSGFALAHAALAGTQAWMYLMRYDMTPARLVRQRAEAEIALRLAPNLPEALQAMGSTLNVGPNTDPHAALRQWRLALRSAPNDVRLIRHTAAAYRQTGNWEEYEKAFLRAVELDPRNVEFLSDYGGDTHVRMGRFADAIRWYERAASITGDTIGLALAKAWTTVHWKGDLSLVRAWMHGEGGRRARQAGWIYVQMAFYFYERQPDSMLAVLEQERQLVYQGSFSYEPIALWSAAAHELSGDRRAARAAYESALILADSGIRTFVDDFSVHQARGMALAGLGRRAEALDEMRTMRQNFLYRDLWIRENIQRGISEIYALLGDVDGTVAELEQLLSQRYTGVTIHALRLDPRYDRVRDHPRFQALLRRYANHPNLGS